MATFDGGAEADHLACMTTHRITPQVLEVLALLARYRYLRKSFIDGLLPHRSADGMNRTLQRLRAQGYVSLPREQFRGYNSLYCCYIYQITPKGLEVLKDSQPERATNLLRQRSDAPVKNFAHSMMICDALASIEIGAGQNDCAFIPLDAILERAEHDNPLKLPCRIKGQPASLVPDGLFGIRYASGNVWFYVLEAEHYNPVWPTNNLKRASFRKKCYAYNDIAMQRPYRKQLAIPNLRYLFLFPSQTRAENAAGHFQRAFHQTKLDGRIYLTHVPVQEELLKAPPPYPQLFSRTWYLGGTINTE